MTNFYLQYTSPSPHVATIFLQYTSTPPPPPIPFHCVPSCGHLLSLYTSDPLLPSLLWPHFICNISLTPPLSLVWPPSFYLHTPPPPPPPCDHNFWGNTHLPVPLPLLPSCSYVLSAIPFCPPSPPSFPHSLVWLDSDVISFKF